MYKLAKFRKDLNKPKLVIKVEPRRMDYSTVNFLKHDFNYNRRIMDFTFAYNLARKKVEVMQSIVRFLLPSETKPV